MDLSKFKSELPYPKIEVEEDISQAKLLMPNYGGPAGELTSVMTYSFQSYISERYPEIQAQIDQIALVEISHQKLLGQLIFKLGGYPVIGSRTYWNGSYVNYTLNTKKFLQQNIVGEETAILNYERTILNLSAEPVKLMLERLILDEEIHIKAFKDLLAGLNY